MRIGQTISPARELNRGECMTGTVKKAVLITAGLLSLSLGAVGFVLPVVPASPFLVLAVWCFARSSDRLYAKLKNNRLTGMLIREFVERRVIRKKVLKTAMAFLWLSVILAFFLVKNPWPRLVILTLGLAFSLLVRRMNKRGLQ